jgi:uncharacterized oligopeptide transporter (OPT) family protein
VSPAYLGVGYIIGPELSALSSSRRRAGVGTHGSAPHLPAWSRAGESASEPRRDVSEWGGVTTQVWRFIVRPIAVGGMLVGTVYTLYRRR